MKKTLKTILALLLVLALTLSAAACGDKNNGGETPTPNDPGNTDKPEPGNNEPEPSEPEPPKTSEELYMDFLEGVGEVYSASGIWQRFVDYDAETQQDIYEDYLEEGKGYTFAELYHRICESESLEGNASCFDHIRYKLIDCGKDGEPELYIYMSTDYYNYGPSVSLVIKNLDGTLALCFATVDYEMTYTAVGDQGVITSVNNYGGGMTDSMVGYIDDGGVYRFVYSVDSLYGLWSMSSLSVYDDLVETYGEDGLQDIYVTLISEKPFKYEEMADYYASAMYDIGGAEDDDTISAVEQVFKDHGYNVRPSFADIDDRGKEIMTGLGFDGAWGEPCVPEDVTTKLAKDLCRFGIDPVSVKSAGELMAAIDNNKVIAIEPGKYDLSDYDYYVRDISNLRLVAADPEKGAQIVIKNPYDDVMVFTGCYDITLIGLTFGHDVEKGECGGNVLGFWKGWGYVVEDCDLYGCGAYGLDVQDAYGVRVQGSVIHDCTYGVAMILTGGATIENCELKNCEGWTMFYLLNGSLYIENCTLRDLDGTMLSLDENSYVTFADCSFDTNARAGIRNYSGPGSVSIY